MVRRKLKKPDFLGDLRPYLFLATVVLGIAVGAAAAYVLVK